MPNGEVSRFQYTAQKWVPSLGMYDCKARTYSPKLGRFLQTDPIGYFGQEEVDFTDLDFVYHLGVMVCLCSGDALMWKAFTCRLTIPKLPRQFRRKGRSGLPQLRNTS